MLKLNSIQRLKNELVRTFLQYPTVLIIALVTTFCSCYFINDFSSNNGFIGKLILTLTLGIPLFFALTVLQKSNSNPLKTNKLIYPIIGAIILGGIFYLLTKKQTNGFLLYYLQYWFMIHLFVSIVLFFGKSETDSFWEYNKTLFIQFIITTIYSIVLWGGLSLILLSIGYLFELKISGNAYYCVWYFCIFTFQTWHFLGSLPNDLNSLKGNLLYPRGLQVFTQYLLLPLLSLYMLILYGYLIKVVIDWSLPKGWISWMISIMSVLGILNLLLLLPKARDPENKWIHTYAKYFYIGLLPLIGMLFLAIIRRIFEYGITEMRYILFAIACWLLGISIYFLLSKVKNIRIIPISLLLLTLVTSSGPWGVYGLSLWHQKKILEHLLIKYEILKDKKVFKTTADISYEEEVRIKNIVSYVILNHGEENLKEWFNDSQVKEELTTGRVVALMGLKLEKNKNREKTETYFNVKNEPLPYKVSGFKYAYNFSLGKTKELKLEEGHIELSLSQEESALIISEKNITLLKINLKELIQKVEEDKVYTTQGEYNYINVPYKLFEIRKDSGRLKGLFYITGISLKMIKNKQSFEEVEGKMFFSLSN